MELCKTINAISDIPLLTKDNVKIKDTEAVLKKLKSLIEGGKDHLQVITDYDLTLTTQHAGGVRTPSSFSLFCQCKGVPPEFVEKDKKLVEKYYPIERDVKMPLSEKIPHMVAWYKQSEELFTGLKLDLNELRDLIESSGPPLREGTIPLCK